MYHCVFHYVSQWFILPEHCNVLFFTGTHCVTMCLHWNSIGPQWFLPLEHSRCVSVFFILENSVPLLPQCFYTRTKCTTVFWYYTKCTTVCFSLEQIASQWFFTRTHCVTECLHKNIFCVIVCHSIFSHWNTVGVSVYLYTWKQCTTVFSHWNIVCHSAFTLKHRVPQCFYTDHVPQCVNIGMQYVLHASCRIPN